MTLRLPNNEKKARTGKQTIKVQFFVKTLLLFFTSLCFQQNAFGQNIDLSLKKEVDKSIVAKGDTVTFTLTIYNEGGTDATGVQVIDMLPAGATYLSHAVPGSTTYSSVTGLWNVGAEITAATDSLKMSITTRLDTTGVVFNDAEVSSMNGVDVDSNPGDGNINDDDYASACVTVPIWICSQQNATVTLTAEPGFSNYQWYKDGVIITGANAQNYIATQAGEYSYTVTGSCPYTSCCPVTLLDACIDLALQKTLDPSAPQPAMDNDVLQFNLTVTNQGTSDAYEVLLKDYLPTGLLFSTANNTVAQTGNANNWNTNVTYLIDFLAVGQSSTIKLFLTVDPVSFPIENFTTNRAEITFATNSDGGVFNATDIDSNFDDNPNNDIVGPDNNINNLNNDEDDHDYVVVTKEELFDPQGYLYCEKTGKLVTGGTISVTGPGAVYITQDGLGGVYQFFTDGTPGVYTLSYNHPSAFPLSIECPATPGPFDPTGTDGSAIDMGPVGDNEVSLGVDTLGGMLSDTTCANNPYYLTFDLVSTDPFVHRNNLPIRCAYIGAVACQDDNFNEAFDATDPGMPGVKTYLYDCNNLTTPIDSVETNAMGGYEFDGLPAGDYRLQFVTPAGYRITQSSTIDANGFTSCRTMDYGDCDTTQYVCYILDQFDLALTKQLLTTTPITPGDTVDYQIVVFNQGTYPAYDVQVADYIPTNMTLVDPNWNLVNPGQTYATLANDIDSIGINSSDTVTVRLRVNNSFAGGTVANYAEVAFATSLNGSGVNTPDIDSQADTENTDFVGQDNEINNAGGDEDDHDLESINVVSFDLALSQNYSSFTDNDGDGGISPGDLVFFNITTYNQGNVDATNVEITNYVPADMTFDVAQNPGWTAGATTTVASLPAGASSTTTIALLVNPAFQGTEITNWAEISDDNSTAPDEDSTPDGINFNQAGETNDLIDDNVINQSGLAGADEDDHDPALITIGQVFDLALIKQYNAPNFIDNDANGVISAGDVVTFDITVYNQGSLDAFDISVVDYLPAGTTLNDTDWNDADGDGKANLVTAIPTIAAGGNTVVPITLTINAGFQETELRNAAEISFATSVDNSGVNTPDIDSTPDIVDDNDQVGGDDVINNTGGDEDDHDFHNLPVAQTFDLALINTLNGSTSGPFVPGSTVTFDMTITNQGTIDAYDIQLANYVPAGLTLTDANWTLVGNNAVPLNEVPYLGAGDDVVVSITYMVNADFTGTTITDWAEISFATDTNGSTTNTTDIDSQADATNFNQGGETNDLNDDNVNDQNGNLGQDEDDHDPVQITVDQTFDLALSQQYNSYTDNDGDGMISPGDDVFFAINVINQGTLPASNVEVTNYVPTDMTFFPSNNPGWTAGATHAVSQLTPGSDTTLMIALRVNAGFMGTTITNWAEISNDNSATPDVDSSPDGTNFNQAGETDDLADDDVVNQNGNTGGDEDDHDPAQITVGQEFDLALINTFNPTIFVDNDGDGVISPGDDLTFDINVYNQGTLNAYDIGLVNYLPEGTSLNDPDWNDSDGDGVATLVNAIPNVTVATGNTTVPITVRINEDFQGDEIVNVSEISFATATDNSGSNTPDVDSQADAVNSDLIGGDNIIDNTNGDEDDHDFVAVPVTQSFDLALVNTLSGATPGSFTPGSTVTFNMTVTNQGTKDAYDVGLTNYIPAGLTLADSDWTVVSGKAVLLNEIPFVGTGDDVVVPITYVINEDFQGTSITDWAEISFATDTDGSPVNTTDIDSQADGFNFNQPGETNDLTDDDVNNQDGTAGGDEDDHDPVQITVDQTFDLALSQQYTSFTDNDGDGAISPGDDVVFSVSVFNQGTLDATNVEVTDYLPTGLTFNPADNIDFANNAGNITTTIPSVLAGQSATVNITLQVDPSFQGTEITNWVEISNDNSTTPDVDSSPDGANFNQPGETNDLADDNVIDENGQAGGDEDDHDPAKINIGQVFDLALINQYNVPNFVDNDGDGVISPGDDVTFDLTVYNQGTVDAFDISLVNYLPTGTTLNDPDWDDTDGDGTANLITPIPSLTVAAGSTTVPITLRIDEDFQGDELVNAAEISFATANDNSGSDTPDVDSHADAQNTDLIGGDNVLDNAGGDEDDHDFAGVPVTQTFDLALINTLNGATSGPFTPGSTVTFNMTVTNQGSENAYDVQLANYIPAGLTLADSDWQVVGDKAVLLNEIDFVGTGQTEVRTITYMIDEDYQGTTIRDWAEIMFATNTDGSAINTTDIDSNADGNNFNEIGETDDLVDDNTNDQNGKLGGDEDDHDPVEITVDQTFDLALSQQYTSFVDNDNDGQISPGDDVTFNISVLNQGTLNATNVTVTDYLPTGTTFDPTKNPDFALNGTDIQGSIANLPTGQSENLNITLTVDANFQGTTITNWAEISADNAPIPDIDSTPDGINFNQPGETNDLLDDNEVNQNGNAGGDEDDHDPAQVTIGQVFDLALINQYNAPNFVDNDGNGVISPGDDVTFDMTVFNQGTVDAFDVSVVNYLPEGTSLNDPNWDDTDGDGVANLVTSIPDITVAEGSETVSITLRIDPDYQETELLDVAEVSFATSTDNSGVNTPDIDSNADNTNNDQIGGDDVINNSGGDEDDHDFANAPVQQVFDLALVNTLNGATPGNFVPGSTVTFDMTVTNQGTVDAFDVELTNYIPDGLTLADGDWTIVGNSAVLNNEIPSIPAGQDVVVSITYMIDADYQGTTIRDWAEISFATDTDGSAVNTTDIDSNADGTNFNQTGETDDLTDDNVNNQNGNAGQDEDDHDPVEINVNQTFDLALQQAYSSFTDNDGDGVISPGDDVTFDVNVFNQGTLDANKVSVVDYLPAGTTFNPANNADFALVGGLPLANVETLPAGGSSSLSITLRIDENFTGNELTNWAEISDDNSAIPDVDSQADAINFNQAGETNDLADDDVINENGNTGGDEDDHDPALVTVNQSFDLAFTKALNAGTPGPISVGGTVTFDLTVYNQGTLPAYDIQLAEYIPTGLTLTDASWIDISGNGIANLINPIATIPAGGQTTVSISFSVNANFSDFSIINNAEISFATAVDGSGINTPDADSEADQIAGNDIVSGNNSIDNQGGDEDDHDFEEVAIEQLFDLALINTISPTTPAPFVPGDTVTFDLTVFNQGTLPAYDIELNDYIPTGLTLADSDWTQSGNVATLNSPIASLQPGTSTTVPVTFVIEPSFTGTTITNNAEIRFATSTDDSGINAPDFDSQANNNISTAPETANDDVVTDIQTGSAQDDDAFSDDYDPAVITIAPGINAQVTANCSPIDCNTSTIDVSALITWAGVANNITVTFAGQTQTIDVVGGFTPPQTLTFTVPADASVQTLVATDGVMTTSTPVSLSGCDCATASNTIDNFTTANPVTILTTITSDYKVATTVGSDIIGGERDIRSFLTVADPPSDVYTVGAGAAGFFSYNEGGEVRGGFELTYDGVDGNAQLLNPTGLGGIDLSNNGVVDAFALSLQSDLSFNIRIEVYTDGNNSSFREVAVNNTNAPFGYNVPFSDFQALSGTGADFSSVGAIKYIVNTTGTAGDLDMQVFDISTTCTGCLAPPVARDDKVFTEINTPVVIDVQANDTEATGGILTTAILTQPANGTVTLLNNDSISYTPNNGFFGVDVFTYSVTNQSGGIDEAAVTVVINECGSAGVIDLFSTASPFLNLNAVGNLTSVDVGGGIIGGERNVTTHNYQADPNFEVYTFGDAFSQVFRYVEGGPVRGGFVLAYDDFGTTDLTGGGTKGSIDVAMKADLNAALQLRVYSSPTDYATYTLPVPGGTGINILKALYTDFTAVGAGADFTAVTRIEIEFDSRDFAGNRDMSIYCITTGCSTNPCDPNPLANPTADCDGDGVTNGQEALDGTDHQDPCAYTVSSQVVSNTTATWNALDCDGDGVTNAQELTEGTSPQDPCEYLATSVTLPQSAGWSAADCDEDGVTNGQELTDGTDPKDPCSYNTTSVTLAQTGQWSALDCDGDGVTNAQELADGTDPKDPCSYNVGSQVLTNVTLAWNALDCDGDGVRNEVELIDGTNPQDPCEYSLIHQIVANVGTAWGNLDCDGDGVINGQELLDDTNPLDPCDYNVSSQVIANVTAVWNNADCDGDGVINGTEVVDGTNPQDPCDFVAASITLPPTTTSSSLDCDGDGVTNAQETIDGTDPNDPCQYNVANQVLSSVTLTWNTLDCDGDGVNNGTEITDGTSPLDPCSFNGINQNTPNTVWNTLDCDGDGVLNGQELTDGTDPLDPCSYNAANQVIANVTAAWSGADCDGDGVPNAQEIIDGTDPTDPCSFNVGNQVLVNVSDAWNALDCDGDGVPNGQEVIDGTGPSDPCAYNTISQTIANVTATWNNLDCDGDGVVNGQEIIDGTGAADPCDFTATSITLVQSGAWNTIDCDGDGVLNGTEITDGTNPLDPCDYNAASITVTVTATWALLDCDGDGVVNGQENLDGTDPADPCSFNVGNQIVANVSAAWNAADCDGDGVNNGTEVQDGTGPTDPCDFDLDSQNTPTVVWTTLDCDGDGVLNGQELTDNTNPLDPCSYNVTNQVLANVTANWNLSDCDGDGVNNGQELLDGTNVLDPCDYNAVNQDLASVSPAWNNLDCDGDGVNNGLEIIDGTDLSDLCDYNPVNQVLADVTANWNNADCDGDGVVNGQEVIDGTGAIDPCDFTASNVSQAQSTAWNAQDCDGDGVTNGQEVIDGTNPLDPCDYNSISITLPQTTIWATLDCDGDGVTNQQEVTDGTGPNDPCDYNAANQILANVSTAWNIVDCDGDGVNNGTEIQDGTGPLDPCNFDLNNQNTPSTVWSAQDCDGDGVLNGDEFTDGTSPLDPCSYNVINQNILNVTIVWNSADCDGDGVTNIQEVLDNTDPQDPCTFNPASQILANVTAVWNELDCDGDGVNNEDEGIDGTDPNDVCDYNPINQTLPVAVNWNNADCDGDGVINGQEEIDGTEPDDPCSFDLASVTQTATAAWNDLDCDNDGINNGQEVIDGSNPSDICDPLSPTLNPTATYNLNPDCSPADLFLNAGLTPSLGQITNISWSGPNNWTAFTENPTIPNVTEDFNGNYIVSITDANGCVATEIIEVQGILDAALQPQIVGDGSICMGETIVLSVPAYQATTVVYNWTFPGTGANISGLGTNEIIVGPVLPGDAGNYAVEVVLDGVCTINSNPYPVVVYEGPDITLNNDATECIAPGTDINLSVTVAGGSGTSSVLWSGPNGFSSANLNPVIPNAVSASSGTYTVVVTDLNGCSASASTVVDVTTLPVTPVQIVFNNTLCTNEILELETQPYNGAVVTYNWIFEGATNTTYTTTVPSLTILDVTAANEGFYSVYVNVDGCSSLVSASEYVTVGAQGVAPVLGPDIAVCEGDPVALTTTTIAQNYSWTGPNGFTSNEQNPSVITNASLLNIGTYTLITSNNGCLSAPASVTVSVEAVPEAPILVMENALCQGTDIVLTAVGNPAFSYQWISPSNTANGFFGTLGDPNNVIWTTSASTTITEATHPQFYESGEWTVQAVSANGCVSETAIAQALSINPIPQQTVATNAGAVCEFEDVQLFASPIPNANYKWFDSDPYAAPNVSTLISTEQNPIVAGLPANNYDFFVTVDVAGCEPTVAAMTSVNVVASPVVDAVTNNGPFCIGEMIMLEAPSIPGASYSWTGPNGFTSFLEDPVIPDADILDEGVYTLVVNTPLAICPSAPVTTNVSVSALPATPVVSNNGPGCEDQQIQLFGSDVPVGSTVVYNWTGPNGFTSNIQNPVIPNLTANDVGDYVLTVEVDGCPSLASAPTTIEMTQALPAPMISSNTSPTVPACEGSSIELSTDLIPGATYQWYGPNGFSSTDFNPVVEDIELANQGSYTLIVTFGECTSPAATTDVFVQPAPDPQIATNEGPVCVGNNLALSTGANDPNMTYEWFYASTNASVGTGPLLNLTNVNEDMAGDYYVVATINGCPSDPSELLPSGENAFSEVVVHKPSEDQAYAGDDIFTCTDRTDLEAYVVTDWSGSWSKLNDTDQATLLTPNERVTPVLDLELGANTFLWSIESGACGITGQDTIVVTYEEGPETFDDGYITPIDTRVVENLMLNDLPNTDEYNLNILRNANNGFAFINSDGTFDYTPNQGFTGRDTFTYMICNANCPDLCSRSVVRIDIGTDAECIAPQAITPNDDGFNDTFIVPCLTNVDKPVLCVYNRWGDEVYHSEDYKNDWGGTYKDETLPVGVYFYVLTAGEETLKGYVMIKR